jgi:hypothetical protein
MATKGENRRPYRLYDATAKKNLPWRFYKHPHNAHNGAILEIWWAKKIGWTIEVINVDNGRMLAQYTRELKRIAVRGRSVRI